ncbi:MAG: hypothetical protein N2234_02610 [Planctomycetota bacterium]|nr:hypothetical protein [Planctomycetota bacterium]
MRFVGGVFIFISLVLLYADEVVLKDGSTLRGDIREDGEHFVVMGRFGKVTVKKSDIARIRAGEDKRIKYAEYERRASEQDMRAQIRLAELAREEGLREEEIFHLFVALKSAPEDVKLLHRLGFLWVDGRWRSEKRLYREDGWRFVNGKWLSPEETERKREEEERKRKEAKERQRRISERISQLRRKEEESKRHGDEPGVLGLDYCERSSALPTSSHLYEQYEYIPFGNGYLIVRKSYWESRWWRFYGYPVYRGYPVVTSYRFIWQR